jgi:lipopolysaccharide/colanic/teichoic acid biosynthesis glycosyltransferase
MSLVGPRPLLASYRNRYNPTEARRHEVRPGITGWAQVHGRNALSWQEKFRLDVWYVDHRSFLLTTVWRTIRPSGIDAPGRQSVREFIGTPDHS